jgi:hypothetical protein
MSGNCSPYPLPLSALAFGACSGGGGDSGDGTPAARGPDKSKLLQQTIVDSTWAARNPPKPAIVVGQAPNRGDGVSWGGFAGFEEFNGIIRGMQFYDSLLTLPQIDSELAAPGSAVQPWYLNLNPTPTDITDKSG